MRASGSLDAIEVTIETNDGYIAKQWYAVVGNDFNNMQRSLKVFAICE